MVGVTKKTFVTFDGYSRAKGLTYLADMYPEKLPNNLFFESGLAQEA